MKICGLTHAADVDAAVEAGADLAGFIFVDWSPRAVTLATARPLVERVPDHVATVGVFVDADPDEVARIADELALDHVQLHGNEPPAVIDRFGARAIKAHRLPVAGELYGDTVLLDRAFHATPSADQLREHWATARAVAEDRRVLLAGALTSRNVAAAIVAARPWAVDAVRATERSPGVKDHELIARFVRAAKEARCP